MIDLTKKLPNTIMVNGGFFKIKTDFRIWIEFYRICRNDFESVTFKQLNFIFIDAIPTNCIKEIYDFYNSFSITPMLKSSDKNFEFQSPVYGIDFLHDGEYLYSSFLKDYQIDLLETELHWHVFLSLCRGLSENTIISKIQNYRGYEKPSKNHDHNKSMLELKKSWTIKKTKSKPNEPSNVAKFLGDSFILDFG